MVVQVVEAFYRQKGDGEYSGRFSAKPYWSTFGDSVLWDHHRRPHEMTVAVTTADGKSAVFEQIRRFAATPGPAVLILGAHGGKATSTGPHSGRYLHFPGAKGEAGGKVSWAQLREWFGQPTDSLQKAVIFDACSFCRDGKEVKSFGKSTGLGLIVGYSKDIPVFDSLLFHLAFVSYLLFHWGLKGSRGYEPEHLASQNPLADFGERYGTLAQFLGMRVFQNKAGKCNDITKSILPNRAEPSESTGLEGDA